MKVDRVEAQLELAQMRLLLCKCPIQSEVIAAEIHQLKTNLYQRRTRDRNYRDRHSAFQKSRAGQ